MTKALIFDSGTLINLSMNGLLYILEELKKTFDGQFLITEEVRYEVLDKPLKVQRFELEALRVKRLVDSKVLEFYPINLDKKTSELMRAANHSVRSDRKWIKIVSEAEISCLALSSELSKKKIENLIAVDERTTRILSEKPQNLKKIMTKRLRKRVDIELKNLEAFKKYRFIRSSELAYVAHKKGLLRVKGPLALEAVLYATKFKGSAISWDEIKELKRL